ncbi:hypothetical protein PYCCODRAFT_1379187, partial [Trametes coccinea BRFM310]
HSLGLFQHGKNWADGAVCVNQCPIAIRTSFLYDFTAMVCAARRSCTIWMARTPICTTWMMSRHNHKLR